MIKNVNGVNVEMTQAEIAVRTAEEAAEAAKPAVTAAERAGQTLANDIVFRALVKTLAARFGVSVQTLVNEIKSNA